MSKTHHLDSMFENMIDDIKYIKRATCFFSKNK